MTDRPEDTAALGADLARILRPGDVVLLTGELGAGKTTLVRGAARALGVTAPVTSPTFTLARRYAGTVPVGHVDAYRLGTADEEEVGLVMASVGDDAVVFVEWPDALCGGLPPARVAVHLEHRGGDGRLVRFSTHEADLLDTLGGLIADPGHRHGDPRSQPGAGGRG